MTGSTDLRVFLEALDKKYPGELLRISVRGRDFSLADCDAAALLAKLRQRGKKPAVLFKDFKTLSGKLWGGELLFSELVTPCRQAVALGLPGNAGFKELAREFSRRSKSGIPPLKIDSSAAPVKEVVQTENISLFDLPAYRKDAFDAKPGWLCAIAVAKDVESGRYNLSWHRHHVHAPDYSSVRVNPRHLMEYMNRYRAQGHEEIPVAFVLGHHPMFEVASGSNCPWGLDEYEFAGGLLGEPVRVTESESLGADFLVPADAEIIVEGKLHLKKREVCGPWADAMKYYSPQTLEPVFRPSAVLMRKNPICIGNWTGHDTYGSLGAASYIYTALRERYPRVTAVHQVAPFTYVVQFRPASPGESNRLALMALGSFGDRIKNIIVVDEDINPFDLDMVFFAISTRVDAESGQVQILKSLLSNRQDPSTERFLRVGGLIIDATKPVGKPFPEIGMPPEDAMSRVQLENFVSANELEKIPTQP